MHGDKHDAEDDVAEHRGEEEDDEGPGAAEAGDDVGDAFTEGLLFVDEFVGVAQGAAADDALCVVDLGGEDGEHVEASLGFFSRSAERSLRSISMQDVGSVAMAVVRWGTPSSMEAKPKKSPGWGWEKTTS